MSNPNQEPQEPNTPVQPVAPVAPVTETTATEPTKDQTIPKHRFDEVYGKMKTMEQELEKFKAQEEARARKALEETQQYEQLYKQTATEVETFKSTATQLEAKATQYETVISSLVETKLATIPAEYHDLIPANLSVVEKLDWLNKAETKGLFGNKALKLPIGQPTNVPHKQPDLSTMSPLDKLQNAYGKK